MALVKGPYRLTFQLAAVIFLSESSEERACLLPLGCRYDGPVGAPDGLNYGGPYAMPAVALGYVQADDVGESVEFLDGDLIGGVPPSAEGAFHVVCPNILVFQFHSWSLLRGSPLQY